MGRINSLRTKLILIMILLILSLMTVVGAFLLTGVSNFYIGRFYDSMDKTFSQDFILSLSETAERSSNPPQQLTEMLMAQSELGIDMHSRNVYILDRSGAVLAGSGKESSLSMTENLLAGISGKVGQTSSSAADYMDLAVPLSVGDKEFVIYILDDRATVNDLTGEVLTVVLQSLILGVVISIILSVLLSQILITPITALTTGTRQVAAGDFSQKLTVASRDEIGTLTRNFNHMSQVLQSTLSQVENERNKLSTLFLHMTDGVVAFSPDGMLIHCNPAAKELLRKGMDPTLSFQDLFGEDADFAEIMSLKRTHSFECEKQVGDKELALSMAPFSPENAQGGALVVIHDVTEQRKSERARREFVANVSHELRTPLTNVKSYAETIVSSGDDLPPELRNKFLGVIMGETDRMTRIVQDLLTLSRFDYGKMEMQLCRFSLADALLSVYEAERIDAENHKHTLSLDYPRDDKMEILGDKERIEQVIMNIVSNAIKYTPDGGEIRIAATRQKEEILLRISDNGIGVPEKDLPHLFERFYRVDKARSRQSGGTGLGLSIAREILSMHKGSIRIESVFGQGTDVYISLPAVQ